MLTAALITSILLSVAALWLALTRARASRSDGARLDHLSAEMDEGSRELEALRQELAVAVHKIKALRERERAREDASNAAYALSDGAESRRDDDDAALEAATDPAAVAEEPDVHALARQLDEFFNATTHPRQLLDNALFLRGAQLSRDVVHETYILLARATDYDAITACMSLEALVARVGEDDLIVETILRDINTYYYWPRFFALRALDAHTMGRPILARMLARLNSSWREFVPMEALREFVAGRVAAGEAVTAPELLEEIKVLGLGDEQITDVGHTLGEIGDALPEGVLQELSHWKSWRETTGFLKTLGRVWEPGQDGADEVFVLDAVAARVAELESAIKREPARSLLLVGESGTGKTALVRALARRLRAENWLVFEAGASEVMAGQTYLGQIEERVQTIMRHIGGRRVLWVMPNFHEALWAGRHRYSPVGLLDLLLPSIESGSVKIIGEVPAEAYEQLLRLRPKLRTAMQTCRVAPLSDEDTLELGRRWAESHAAHKLAPEGEHSNINAPHVAPYASERTLHEALQLAKQYLGDKAAPGNLLLLLDAAHRRLLAEEKAADEIKLDDLLVTLSQLTGLPVQILDEREGLDLSELRAFFERRVLGQPEAVDCLVERVAMVKAGLTDPTRPQGVFLFVGPTGTGKTEIAKTLAEFLFGSPDRMIRLDMSELQTWESQARVLGESEETSDSAALVNLIRKQPFSVVLLDEFEKAHPAVWDLFLQVFDDGRLTDRRGNTADFRHSVIILTSNLGATLPHGASVGFAQEQSQFAAGSVERAVGRAFRREFVNRIDRVVVFRPLGRTVMRELLRKELNDVLTRRGLRTRQWAVEWDESAVEFLLEKGFTADLGARPLKRAVERYLLSPLALSIVNHQFPEGDQFLFVRSSQDGQSLDVEFVDPDAPEHGDAQVADPAHALDDEVIDDGARELRLEAVALDPKGTPEELRFLHEKFDGVAAQVDADAWRRRKQEALGEMQSGDFWSSPERFVVLGAIEYMDRIEAGLDTAGSLLARLRGDRKRLPPDLVARLAQQLYLLDSACRGIVEDQPRDAFLLVTASREAGADRARSEQFARSLTRMYRRWAERRRMRFEFIEEHGGAHANGASAEEYHALAAISGYAAYTILRHEAGLHVLETPQDDKSFNRVRATVRVVGQPDEPAGRGPEALRTQAARALASEPVAPQQIVRRYREEPSPLVRDSARGWRTGRLERVLDGDFDLIT
ncbi:MAG: ATP-dependent Clp protease ATP-binding subunit ClpC [Acidobacteriota bacterium]|jgi:ATP-dependent Clp protease ATP-binding subunit ClpC|nr:ATP-dependent Clp protease ATP-binding subunit ClpC [Acidobacteriota bacterium]